jgi:hypothetical protein
MVMLMVGMIMLAASANAAAQEKMGFSFLSSLGMISLTNLLLFTLFVLLAAYLVRQGSSKYYNRIRLREPKISKKKGSDKGQAFRLALRVIIVIAIVVALFFIIYYAIKLAPVAMAKLKGDLSGPKGNQTTQTTQNITNPTQNKSIASQPGNLSGTPEEKANAAGLLSRVIMNYGGYVILGFILLIILVSVIGRKINC